MGKAADLGNSIIGKIPKAVITFHDKAGNSGVQTDVARSIEVQYNPSSISFSTVADDAELQSMQNSNNSIGIIFQNTCPTNTTMSVDLIFDDINNLDAFMNEKFMISTGMLASAVAKANYKTYSVKHRINAFIGMITNSQIRCVTFLWSRFSFYGELTNVSSELTMFNVSGNPIRGKVSLSIQQKENGNSASENEFNKAFDKLFSGNLYTSAETDSKSAKDKFGNLLNLNVL